MNEDDPLHVTMEISIFRIRNDGGYSAKSCLWTRSERRRFCDRNARRPTRKRGMRWKVGRVKITKVVELETVGSTRFILPLATNEEIRKLPWLIPDFATEEGRLKM